MNGYVPTKEDVAIIKGLIEEGWVDPTREFSLSDLASVVYRRGKQDGINQCIEMVDKILDGNDPDVRFILADVSATLRSLLEEGE